MRTVGIIGGLGPETTAEFYLEVIFGCYQRNKENRPPILVWNIPMNYKIEEDLLIRATGERRYLPYLLEAARKLEAAGASFLVVPCNSVHIFIDEIRNAVRIPVLSIVEETAAFLKSRKMNRVGVLATQSSLNNKLYETALESEGITQVIPDGSDQAGVGEIIDRIVLNRHSDADREQLLRTIGKLTEKDVDAVILACTDLQLLAPKHDGLDIFDTMKILAEATVNKVLE